MKSALYHCVYNCLLFLAAGASIISAACAQPAAELYQVSNLSGVMVPMRDGVSLATDVYFPARNKQVEPGKWPVVLTRTPYDKSGNASLGNYYAAAVTSSSRKIHVGDMHRRAVGIG